MPTAIITGSGGLIGSESVRRFTADGFHVVGVDNDLRAAFFGADASTRDISERLAADVEDFKWEEVDIRDENGVEAIFARHARDLELVVHTAAQPSHDWAAREPKTDFSVNASGTLNLLE